MDSAITQTHESPEESKKNLSQGLLFRLCSEGRREMVFWILQTSFWAAIWILGALMILAFRSTVPDVGWALSIRVASGFVMTAGLRVVYLQPWVRRRGSLEKWSLMAGCCLAAGVAEAILLQALIVAGVSLPGDSETFGLSLLFVRVVVLLLWSFLYFTVHLLEEEHALELRATRAELAARENELSHLQAQLIPHFVLNSLNAALACKDDPEAVRGATKSLAEYLRFLLQETRPLEPLSRELDALEKFLVVQTSHFNKNLVCRIKSESAARSVMVPPMIVQPLLENAFRHRPQAQDHPLQIWLTARVEAGFLRITLSNTGESVPPPGDPRPLGGIPALRQRLRLLLGQEARVEEQTDKGWILVTVHIPVNPDLDR